MNPSASLAASAFDHPVGKVVLFARRNVGARVNALAGYRADQMLMLSAKVTAVHTADAGSYNTTS